MIKRIINPLKTRSFFLFGARGTGKSTYISECFSGPDIHYIDLLNSEQESKFALNPERLSSEIAARSQKPSWVVIDEVQKVPKLLDVVHHLIESKKLKFILSGSSARKLKRGAANLLAGRAFVYQMYPLTYLELGKAFKLDEVLRWGALPEIQHLNTDREKTKYLNSYIQTYFAEEIRAEQIVRKLDPFRAFLPVLGQVSGKIINHKKISDDVGVSTVTIQSYFQIIEDTLLGFYLPAFHLSVRKSQRQSPKFYLFDTGVKKALEESLEQVVSSRTSVFGELFESFLINEIYRLNSYFEKSYRLSYYATKNDVEIDLVLSKNRGHILIEIKSTDRIDEREVRSMEAAASAIPNVQGVYYLSNDPTPAKIGYVTCLPWHHFLKNFQKL